ncbi:MAG: LEA type 2 family protein, partial [Bacteroidales bacterium]|nr:LEA type 2 family protein [Bacteroidales bacterium]
MKRILICLTLVLLAVACKPTPTPVIRDYRITGADGFSIGLDGVTADMVLELDVENPASVDYTLESLDAILYKGVDTNPYANLTMRGTATIAPKSTETVPIPVTVRILRPLSILATGFDTDLSKYEADVDLTIRR